jgi:RimJ/RimL family protein N-acetyltransferase
MHRVLIANTALVLLFAAGCQSPKSAPSADPWSLEFNPPRILDTPRVHLEPLGPEHAALDHAAFMSSRTHLQNTLQWGSWPAPDMTVEQNRKDLARHGKEFVQREAYAYTVLQPGGKKAVGCIYINAVEGHPRSAAMAYWIIASELPGNLDAHLIEAVLNWMKSDWPFNRVIMSLHNNNARGMGIADALEMKRKDKKEHHVVFEAQLR